MMYTDLESYIPKHFEMIVLSSRKNYEEVRDSGVVCLSMPVKSADFVNTVSLMIENLLWERKKRKSQPKERTEEEKKILWEAKAVLMERNHMTEEEAHRYIQKCSMDSGTSLTETAQMVLSMIKL